MADEVTQLGKAMWELYKRTSLMGPLIDVVEETMAASNNVVAGGALKQLAEEAKRQEFKAMIQQAFARTQQEIAIARRIETAEEVEIEEFYDTGQEESAGLSVEPEKMTLGLAGKGRSVTKRIYRFKGQHSAAKEVFEQVVQELSLKNERLEQAVAGTQSKEK